MHSPLWYDCVHVCTGSAETVRKYIFGGHVGDYMTFLKDEDEEKFNRQFKRYIDSGIKSDSFEKLYAAAHKVCIRIHHNDDHSHVLITHI